MLVEHETFTTKFSKLNVHGSWVRAVFHTLRTGHTGRQLQVFFHAVDARRAIITEGCAAPYCTDNQGRGKRHTVANGVPPFIAENVMLVQQVSCLNALHGRNDKQR